MPGEAPMLSPPISSRSSFNSQVGRKRDAQAYLKQALQRVDSDILLEDRRRMKRNIEKALAELK